VDESNLKDSSIIDLNDKEKSGKNNKLLIAGVDNSSAGGGSKGGNKSTTNKGGKGVNLNESKLGKFEEETDEEKNRKKGNKKNIQPNVMEKNLHDSEIISNNKSKDKNNA
jgi:hypothetical protein